MNRDPATDLFARLGVWNRFRQHRAAMVGLGILATMLLLGVATLPFARQWYNLQDLSIAIRHPPSLRPVVTSSRFLDAAGLADQHGIRATLWKGAYELSSLLGHDDLGRSFLYRLGPATLISFATAGCAALMALGIGTLWGSIAALSSSRIDTMMMRIVDTLYGLPYILMVILLQSALAAPLRTLFGQNRRFADVIILIIAIGAVSWLTMARVVRGQVLSLRAQPFVEAARAAGAGWPRILCRHVLPNLIGPVIVCATLIIPQAILQESFLGFLGIGIEPPTPSLGRLAAEGVQAVNAFVGFWWLLVFPCGVLVVALLALNFVGDGLSDAVNPKSTSARLI